MGPTRRVLLPAGATRGHLRRIMIPVLLTLALLISCRGDGPDVLGPAGSEDLQGDDPSGPVMVSDAVAGWGLNATVMTGAGLAANSGLSWVSFPPATYPAAEQANVRNIGAGLIVNGRIIDGGLDPTPVLAEVGDSIEVTALEGERIVARTVYRVPERTPPVIVRSQPPRGRKGVPINLSIILVFSEPVDEGSVGSGPILLRQADTRVPTRVTRLPDGFTVQVDPLEDLEPASEYSLRIGTGVTDLSGDHLEASHRIDFETDIGTPQATVIVRPDSVVVAAGMSAHLSAQLFVGTVYPVMQSGTADSWVSSDPSVAVVSEGTVTAIAPGEADISATFGEHTSFARVTVLEGSGLVLSSVAAGGSHTCGLTSDGAAFCWGSNVYGQLGHESGSLDAHSTVPVPVDAPVPFVSLSSGGNHTCGLSVEGDLYCWGRNAWGQLGDGSTVNRATPEPISGAPAFVAASAGGSHTCALTTAGMAYCWGANEQGQAGPASEAGSVLSPLRIASGVDREGGLVDLYFREVAAGPEHTCGISETGRTYCWGSNAKYQLGQACGTDMDGATVCWPGLDATPASSGQPLEYPYLQRSGDFTQLSAGRDHTCVARRPGSPNTTDPRVHDPTSSYDGRFLSNWSCWGEGAREARSGGSYSCIASIGAGALVPCGTFPISIERFTDVIVSGPVAISSGLGHACALLLGGTAYCWGADEYGQRGDGNHSDPGLALIRPAGDLQLAAISAGGNHSCGVTFAGETYCWGRNDHGQLGDGSTVDQISPVRVVF